MPPLHRPTRIGAALLVIFLLYLIFEHLSLATEQTPPADSKDANEPSKEKKPAIELPKLKLEDSNKPLLSGLPADTGYPEINSEAHKLHNADAFKNHFKAVTQLPGMTMAEAKTGCIWPEMEEVNFQYAGTDEWVKTDTSDEELELRRKEWHNYVENNMLPYEQNKDKFQGKGIIIVGGNQKSMKRVKVILNQLKRLNSKLPIEIHYWAEEMNEESQKDISTMWHEIHFNDLSSPTNIMKTNHNGPYINYQLKTAAVVNSRFAEPLLLDTDNIPIIDPAELYETAEYKDHGTLFWPDIARTRPNNPMWGITNTACKMDEYEQESGQLIVDKHKFFYHLQLAAWFNNEHAAYYNTFLLGDKDMFRFTWHALKTRYGRPKKWITSVGTLNGDYYCGHSFAQHHPDGRVAFLHGGLLKTITKEVMKWQRENNGGIFQVYKRSEADETHGTNVKVSIKWDGADYFPDKKEGLGVASCTDYWDVEARPLDEIVPGFEKIYEEIGGYWMLEEPTGSA
ncbi:MAG: hypothetical protein MMC23_008795 [Stictis urceolatum]|nr:hypothetical protein [Stictis urceolata]